MSNLIDATERHLAVTDFSRDLLVEAGAGTGKTTLLVQRVLEAILVQKYDADRLVLITFMEKAAAEIRTRLHQALARVDGENQWRARAVLQRLNLLRITTIHGFCMGILKKHSVAAEVPIGFEVMDPIEVERLWEVSFQQWIKQSAAANSVIEDLFAARVSMATIRELARTISSWDSYPLPPISLPLIAQELPDVAHDIENWTAIARKNADISDAGRRQVEELARYMSGRGTDPWQWIRTIQGWPSTAPKGNKKLWRQPDLLTEQKSWLKEELGPRIRDWQTQLADYLLHSLMKVVADEFVPLYQHRLFNQGKVSFDDLLRKTRDVLTRRPMVAESVRQSFDLMMVDEFQDTDPLQTEILMLLTRDRPGTLFLVGDPKQAIYRFRGADVELYTGVREELSQRADGAVLPIVQNFRSQPEILDAVNRYFSQRFLSSVDPQRPYLPVYSPLQTHRTADERIRVIVDGGPIAGNAEQRRHEEATLAVEIVTTALSQKWPVYDKDTGAMRPIEYRDMVLIMPSRTGLDIFDAVFHAHQVPLAKESGTGFFRRDEIRGYAALLKALQDPEDEISIVAFLASPWIGLDLELLAQHRNHMVSWDYRQSQPNTAVGKWLSLMNQWHLKWWSVLPEALLIEVLETTKLMDTLRSLEDWAALANIDKLRMLTGQWGASWGADEFAQWLAAKVESRADEEEGLIAAQENAVHFTTVHRSKGLEWPLVIVANWSHRSGRHGQAVRLRDGRAAMKVGSLASSDWDQWEGEAALLDEAEEDRLLYVALTRARDYLAILDTWPKNRETAHHFDILSPYTVDSIRGSHTMDHIPSISETKPAHFVNSEAIIQSHRPTIRSWQPSTVERHFVETLRKALTYNESFRYNIALNEAKNHPFFTQSGMVAWQVPIAGTSGETEVDQLRMTSGGYEVLRCIEKLELVHQAWPDRALIDEVLTPCRYWVWEISTHTLHDMSVL
ncbi:MAG: DNA helicase UvrD [Sulfobacillus benefaciens]|uniref:DNA 3'-5' helicase n=1 Tax=Sulfobacillus benefaciens TaxID=453960 RepID=A0A2T2XAX9_9FIRM|nr:MAG: DNA helicase UvrD [Sulfobacillus benefaciens]